MRAGTKVSAALAGLALIALASPSAPAERRWKRLFDGKSLNGWTPKIRGYPLGENFADTFSVKDGAIRVSYGGYDKFGERFGHLFYKTPFKAYRLRLEYRFTDPSPADTPAWAIRNSGVMIFSQDPKTMALGDSFPVSVEAQILGPDGKAPRTNGNVCTPGTNIVIKGALVTQHCIDSAFPATPNGEWVRFEVEVSPKGEVTQRVNGRTTMTYSAVQLDPTGNMADSKPLVLAAGGKLALTGGYISLQSEGAPIEFRRIALMELR
ncbi:MAG: hypothetical protein JWO33_365 [Caulobacteraceae bacterium]|nr:hypothetical protein [Caulobacteraceae bacterium]